MSFLIRSYRRFLLHFSVTDHARSILKLPMAYGTGFCSLIVLLVLGSIPASAEWAEVHRNEEIGMTIYMETDTIRRKGDLVRVWELLDYKTTQGEAGLPHLSVKVQFEYDCREARLRMLAIRQYSDTMGRGKVLLSNSDEDKWISVVPETIEQRLWTVACSNK